MSALDDVIDALMAERYGPSLWWATDVPELDDTELTTSIRRKKMADDFSALTKGDAA